MPLSKLCRIEGTIYLAVARGEIGTDEGTAMMQLLQGQARITELTDLVTPIEILEGGKRHEQYDKKN